MIPSRFQSICVFCKRELNTQSDGVHQWTAGWVMNRSGGGGHAVSLPVRSNLWAHRQCVDGGTRGYNQQSLWDRPPSIDTAAPTNAHYDDQGRFIHDKCAAKGCGHIAPIGVGVDLKRGHLGMWYCLEHWPNNPHKQEPGATPSINNGF